MLVSLQRPPVDANGHLDIEIVDLIIERDRIDHQRGACDEETCYWCEDGLRMVRPYQKSAPTTRKPLKRFNTGPRDSRYANWVEGQGNRKKKKRRKR